MRFAREHASLENKTLLFLEQMMGRLTLTFAAAQLTSQLPNWESETSEGVKSQLVGFKETHPYRVVATTRTQVAVVTPEPVTGRQAITVYNFDNADTMWIYLGGASFPEMTVREYFVRIK